MDKPIDLKNKHIVCLGGGIGTSNLIRGLKKYTSRITVVTSMADDGGSSGRLRKGYKIMPPGDMVSCIAALAPDDKSELAALLLHRFPGHDGENKVISGHKLGNLMMLAEIQRTGSFYKALDAVKNLFGIKADILPATDERTRLSAVTRDGRVVHTETTLDLARYSEPHGLRKVYLTPKNPKVNKKVIDALENADVIISGPGDLYTNQLPVLIVPAIKKAVLESRAKKIFILNIANKPFETKGFSLKDFVAAFSEHLGTFPFDSIVLNDNFAIGIPKKYKYSYIKVSDGFQKDYPEVTIVKDDLVNHEFPIYHNSEKLAYIVAKNI